MFAAIFSCEVFSSVLVVSWARTLPSMRFWSKVKPQKGRCVATIPHRLYLKSIYVLFYSKTLNPELVAAASAAASTLPNSSQVESELLRKLRQHESITESQRKGDIKKLGYVTMITSSLKFLLLLRILSKLYTSFFSGGLLLIWK